MSRREAEIQQLWGSGAFRGQSLRALSGERYVVLYEGRRGAGPGPDFRDAVTLHVVLNAGADRDTALAGGARAALTVLGAARLDNPPGSSPTEDAGWWPCHALSDHMSGASLGGLLRELGVQRLEERAARFADDARREERSSASESRALWSTGDRVVWAALAEGLGYGRDREALRFAGMSLIRDGDGGDLDEWRRGMPSIERNRLTGLQRLLERWRATGPWSPLCEAIECGSPRDASAHLTRALCVAGGAISPGRARILAANVVLPFAVAQARLREEWPREERALDVYGALVAPPSNTITRLLARQLGMSRLPSGAACHMGLQQLWTASCRQKLCATCPCAHR
jgi:hypothetical protein